MIYLNEREKNYDFFFYFRVLGPTEDRDWFTLDPVNSVQIIIAPAGVRVDIIELDVIVEVASNKVHSISDLDGLRELAVGLEVSRLVSAVLQDDVSFRILIISQTNEDDVRLVDPDFLPEFSADVTESLDSVKTHRLQSAIAEHLGDLGVLLAVLFEHQLSLVSKVLVLPSPPVLPSLSLVLRHG